MTDVSSSFSGSNSGLPRWPEGGISRVPYWVYTNEEIYKREQEAIFCGASWSFVALSCELPNPGDYKRTFIGDKPVVVTRAHDGSLNCFVNRCAHRGVQFCRTHRGNAKEFTCPYHQWTYDMTGTLIGVPFKNGVKRQGGMPADFDLAANGLQTLAVAERHGVIFASFDKNMESFEDYLGPEMVGYFDRVFDGRPLRLMGYQRQSIPANWKLMFENIKDPYHASLLHVFLVTFGLFRADNKSSVEMDATGRHGVLVSRRGTEKKAEEVSEMKSFRANLTLQDPNMLQPEREFQGDATVVMQTLWPNLIVQQQSNTLAMRQLITRGPNCFELHWTYFGYETDTPEMRTKRLRQANLMGPAGFVGIDDGEVMEWNQDGVAPYPEAIGLLEMGGRDREDTDHMVTETAIRGFYEYYRKVMGI
jgi:salicylate 5-hydroxylase large subunit